MTLHSAFFNVWAVLASIASNIVIGALWYSPLLFGNTWLRLLGRKPEDITDADANESMALKLIPVVVYVLLLARMLGFAQASTILNELLIGSIVSAGFIGISAFNPVLFKEDGRSHSHC